MRSPNFEIHETRENASGAFVVSKILHLGSMINDDGEHCEELREFIENFDSRVMKDLKTTLDLSPLQPYLDEQEDGDELELLQQFVYICARRQNFGFLCHVEAAEVLKLHGGAKSVRWGLRRLRWFYAEDLKGIIEQADAWALSLEKESPDIPALAEVPLG